MAQNTNANKKKGSDNPGTSKAEVLSDLMGSLECPVCLEFLQPPVYMCTVGHNVCSVCHSKLTIPACPECKAAITSQRNFTIEQIVEKLLVACPNATYGCSIRAPEEKLKAHFDNCEFRIVMCPFGTIQQSCTWTGCVSFLEVHFNQSHPDKVKMKVGEEVAFVNFDVTKADSDIQLFKFKDSLFLYHVKIDPSRQIANWIIQFIGNEENAKKWVYEMVFYTKTSHKLIKAVEDCKSNSVDVQALFKVGNCICIPLNSLKQLLDQNKKLTFKVYVKPIEFIEGAIKAGMKGLNVGEKNKNKPQKQANNKPPAKAENKKPNKK